MNDAGQETGWTYIPVIDQGAAHTTPIGLVIQVRANAKKAFDAVEENQPINGMIRNVWWEGLSSSQRRAFIAKGVKLMPMVTVLEVDISPRDDLLLGLFIMGILGVPTLGVTIVLGKRERKRRRQRTASSTV